MKISMWGAMGALGVGNFLYQMIQWEPDFGVAIERTFFQSVAIGVFVFLNKEKKDAGN